MSLIQKFREILHEPTPTDIKYAAFPDLASALAHKDEYGGWVFNPTGGIPTDEAYWFSPYYRAADVLRHHLIAGMSGTLL